MTDYLEGCGDNGCLIQKPPVGTNAGCTCFGRCVPHDEERRERRRRAMAVALDRQRLLKEVVVLKNARELLDTRWSRESEKAAKATAANAVREYAEAAEAKIETLRRVLAWYANEDYYVALLRSRYGSVERTPAEVDSGERARHALAGLEKADA